jgi:AsmA protein
MRRILTGLVIVFVVIIGIALLAPSLIPESLYRERAQIAASEQLGRDVILGGDVSLQLIPRIEISAQSVTIANAPGFGEEPFAQMSEMQVAVKLLPLFSREIIVDEFVLVDPVIRLEQRGAANNWTLGPDREPATAPSSGEGFVRQPGALPFDASLGDIRIDNGTILYSGNGDSRRIEGLDLTMAMPGVDAPLTLEGSLTADGQAMTFDARLGSMRGLFEGEQTDLRLALGGRLIDFSLDGALREGEDFAFDGALDMTVPDLRAMAAFAGSPLPPGDQLDRFEARGTLSGNASSVALTGATVTLDDITGTGRFGVAFGGARPRITGALELTELNVNPYLPEPAPSGGNSGVPPWPEETIDLAALSTVDAGLGLAVGRLQFREIIVTNADLAVEINNGRLEANLTRFTLYEGSGTARIVANSRGNTPSYSLNARLDTLAALPFLEAAAGFDRLQGLGAFNIDVLTSGHTTAQIMNAIDGTGGFNFADGSIRGVNLAQVIRTVQSSIASGQLPDGFGEQEETDFSALTGTFTITDGVVSNTDLAMLSPLVRVDGAGTVNLGGQSLDYRLRPRAVASVQGQGGDRDMQGIVVPVRIRGSFNNPSVGVDTEAVGRALLQGAVSGIARGESPEDALRGALGAALGLNTQDDETEGETGDTNEEEVDPAEQLLRGLFGRRQNSQSNDEEGGDE